MEGFVKKSEEGTYRKGQSFSDKSIINEYSLGIKTKVN